MMEWTAERVYQCHRQNPNHRETLTRVHFRLRSDGKMFYQTVARATLDDPGYLDFRFGKFLKETSPYRSVSREEFDEIFEINMLQEAGEEITPTATVTC